MCHFYNPTTQSCTILTFKGLGKVLFQSCTGIDDNCKSFKTDKQFNEERDAAIELNRKKGNCAKCKYSSIPCKTSKERNYEKISNL